jgi:hypothetical protein
MIRVRSLVLVVVLALTPLLSGCAGHRAPILVAQSAVAMADIIGQVSTAGKNLTDAAVLTPAINLNLQKTLLGINDKMQPLPELLRTVDRLQQAGDPTQSETDRVIAILTVIGEDISVVVGGVPISDATKVLIDLVRAAQKTVSTVLVEVGKIKGREQ